MKLKGSALLLLIGLTPVWAQAICGPPLGTPRPVLLQGSIVSCRSALPQIEATLERRRAFYEERAQPFRDRNPNADRIWSLRPYDEVKADHLARVEGVIVTFVAESRRDMSADPAWQAISEPKPQELFLRIGGSSCDLLPQPAPTVIVSDFVCCDVTISSENSCILDLPAASLLSDSILTTFGEDG